MWLNIKVTQLVTLNRLCVRDLRNLCSQLTLSATGTRATLIERLKDARGNPTENNTDNNEVIEMATSADQDGSETIPTTPALQQEFLRLQQQVQDLVDRNESDERLLSEGQLTQVKSLVQATINETIEKTAAAVNAFINSASSTSTTSSSQAASSEVPTPNAVTLPSPTPAIINSLVVESDHGSQTPATSSTSQQMSDSIHELPAKLLKEALSGEFMELSNKVWIKSTRDKAK